MRDGVLRAPTKNLSERLFKAYAAEVARVDQNGDGVISGDRRGRRHGERRVSRHTRLFLPATVFNRFADPERSTTACWRRGRAQPAGLGAAGLAFVPQFRAIPASVGRDADDR